MQTLDVPTWRWQTHTLVQLPFCLACSRREDRKDRPYVPPVLGSHQKTFIRDGGHRVVAPEETLARYGHHVSPITGAVPMLEKAAPASDGVLHVYVAGNNMARPHQNLAELRGSLRSMILAITDPRNEPVGPSLQPVVIGLVVVAIGVSWGGMHGYAINPARDFGPRLFTWVAGFKETGFASGAYWVPIAGPCVGGLVGALTYDTLIRPFLPPSLPKGKAG